MKRHPTHQDVKRHSMLVGMYCGFAAAAIACLIAIVTFGPDAVNVFFGG